MKKILNTALILIGVGVFANYIVGCSSSITPVTPISLTWDPSVDNVGVTNYFIERCVGLNCDNFVQIGTSIDTSFIDNDVAHMTTYRYRVRVTDAAGNLSGYSNIAERTTK